MWLGAVVPTMAMCRGLRMKVPVRSSEETRRTGARSRSVHSKGRTVGSRPAVAPRQELRGRVKIHMANTLRCRTRLGRILAALFRLLVFGSGCDEGKENKEDGSADECDVGNVAHEV